MAGSKYRYPCQIPPKDIFGGHLFFLKGTVKHYWAARDLDNIDQQARLKRPLYLYSLGCSALLGNTEALYYFTRILSEHMDEDFELHTEKPSAALQALREWLPSELMASVDNEGIRAIINHNDEGYDHTASLWDPNLPKAAEYQRLTAQIRCHTERNFMLNLYIGKIMQWIEQNPGEIYSDGFSRFIQDLA